MRRERKLQNDNEGVVLYLAQSYSHDPEGAFMIACEITTSLRKKGFVVFSPILHCHNYHQYMKSTLGKSFRGNYVQWDLSLVDRLAYGPIPTHQRGLYNPSLVMIFHDNCFSPDVTRFISKGAEREYKWAKLNRVKCFRLSDVLLYAKPSDLLEYQCKLLEINFGEKNH